ncbi:MAG TPA: TetR/AcrR family transcriptional regulator [Terriglobales bacterium]|nr:TetR/AcrR family transcriptional regulator [Terriglobales bacterium]
MSPKETTFSQKTVLDAAIALVREKGWEALTARGIAKRLKSSVAPVYSAFGSMDAVERGVLEEARRLLHDKMAVRYTEGSFLNVGVGMVVFARDEANLFISLFHARHSHSDIVGGIFGAILAGMRADPFLTLLPEASLVRLLRNLKMYTLGLAAAIVYDLSEDPSTGNIIRQLNNAGNMMIHGEVTGIADAESPENEAVWTRLLKEKNIVLPGTEGPECVVKNQTKERP